jgi:hypothetical protein
MAFLRWLLRSPEPMPSNPLARLRPGQFTGATVAGPTTADRSGFGRVAPAILFARVSRSW